MTAFSYDVAISFLQRDEHTAREIASALEGRLKTFVFSERQRELAGRDGHDKFSEVFGRESRIVVVLYRPDWGKTPWTRVEETAIKNRGHEQGYDFVLFAVMDASAGVPPWLPKTRIWYDVLHFGIPGMAGTIETLVRESGGTVRVESAAEYAARLAQRRKAEENTAALLYSPSAAGAAREEGTRVLDAVDRIIEAVRDSGISLARDRTPDQWLVAFSNGFTLEVGFDVPDDHSAVEARVRLAINEGRVGPNRYANRKKPRVLSEELYAFALGASLEERFWKRQSDGHIYSSEALAEHAMKRLLQRLDGRAEPDSDDDALTW